jgi:hypothetical protein
MVRPVCPETLTINSAKFGGSLVYSNARGRQSTNKKSGLGDKLVNVVDQEVPRSLRLFRHYLLVVDVRLFKNSKCITNNRILREKEWDSPCNDQSNKLNDVVRGQDAARKCCQSMQQRITFLEGVAVKHFVQYAHVCVRSIAKIWSKTTIKG